MGLDGVPELVDALQRRVTGGVKADGISRAGDIVVDGAGDANDRQTLLGQAQQAPEGAVPANKISSGLSRFIFRR